MTEEARRMSGRVCMITGANSGIGKATASGLAQMGATVIMVCRNRERGQAALSEIQRQTGNQDVHLLLADLASQEQIQRLATDFQSQFSALHVLINNAAVIPEKRTVTEDGLEAQFAVNHLAYFLLTHLLLEVLRDSAPSRIINVASEAHHGAALDFDDLQSQDFYRPSRVYSQTKLANILFTYELSRRLQGAGVTANCLHPGVIATKLLADYMGTPKSMRFASNLFGASTEKGARTSIFLASSPEIESVSGEYFMAKRPARSADLTYDRDLARKLWQVSEKLTGLSP